MSELPKLDDPWVIAVRKAEHYCPSELSSPDRWKWKAQFLQEALNQRAKPATGSIGDDAEFLRLLGEYGTTMLYLMDCEPRSVARRELVAYIDAHTAAQVAANKPAKDDTEELLTLAQCIGYEQGKNEASKPAAASESIDTPEFERLSAKFVGHVQREEVSAGRKVWQVIIAHINAHTAARVAAANKLLKDAENECRCGDVAVMLAATKDQP